MSVRLAGVGSGFFALSTARTSKLWEPSASGVEGVWLAPGPERAANGSESKRHWKVEPDSLDAKLKVGVWSLVEPDGPPVIVVYGVESSTYLKVVEHAEMLPATSVALARNKVVVSSATEAVRPGEANWAAEPRASRVPVQAYAL